MNNKSKKVIDLLNRVEAAKRADEKLTCLREGFFGISGDYSYHIENTYGQEGQHKIFELRDNVLYRLFSSLFHCQLLLQQHYIIEKRFAEMYKRTPTNFIDPSNPFLNTKYSRNPHYEYAEKEISALFDSVVFHLSSIYDYMSILINFICVKDKDQTPNWISITKASRDSKNEFNKNDISKIINDIDKDFAIKLYNYRSEIIHRKRDKSEYSFELEIDTGTFAFKFICSDKIKRLFKNSLESETNYTVSYFSMWLIDKATNSIAEMLIGLRKELEKRSEFPQHTFKDGSKPVILYVDPVTNHAKSPSVPNWEKFKLHFEPPSNLFNKPSNNKT